MHRALWSVIALMLATFAIAQLPRLTSLAMSDTKRREDLTKWDDNKLRKASESAELGSEDERQLLEAVRRSGEEWTQLFRERNRALSALIERPSKSDSRRWRLCNLDLLTAIRRIEGKPDPLRILVAGKHKLTRSLHQRLESDVLVVNLDPEKQTIHGLTYGGHDRSGRLERWRFDVRDENGESLPCIQEFGLIGGGLSTTQDLEYGESWRTRLLLREYVLVRKPGRYKVRLHYHNTKEIAKLDNIEEVITVQSDELELEVTPVRVRATEQEREVARQWIAGLPEEGPVKILMDGVIESAKFLSPTSPAGRLQRMHEDAIPDLVDAALDSELSPGKRAWVLALLVGITGHNNPCEGFRGSEILGAYEYQSERSQGSSNGKINPEKQKAFAEQWREWKTNGYFTIEKPVGK